MSTIVEQDAPAASGARSAVDMVEAPSTVVAAGSNRIRVFDLHRQETVERARLRRLQPILETVAHRIGSSLTSAIRQPAHVELVSLEQRTWEEHSSSLPDPTFVSSAVLLPLEGRVVMHIPVPLVLELLDFHLGGDGANQPDRAQLTEIERALVGTLTDVIWNELPPPFATLVSLNVGLVQNSSSALLVQVGRPGVMCLIVELAVTIADHDPETILLSLPLTVLLPVLEHIERHQSSEGMEGMVDRKEARRRILSVPMELKVEYPPISLTPAELLSLRVGDVIHIEQEPSDGPYELQLVVQDTPFGTGILVENGNKLVCTVVSKRESGDE
ncbi:MAG TPA: flagellar motor switch protein FliM [Acidimicrobiales bacterium]|nr:flagellar motor switch protein FliM [Acidimicrobiales bacterium]